MKKILIPIDFSKHSKGALTYALNLNQVLKAELIVFHTTHFPDEDNDKTETVLFHQKLTDKCKVFISTAIKESGLTIKPETIKHIIREGHFVVEDVLAHYAKSKFDMIIMGTHGAGGADKAFLGSSASRMLSSSPVPVLVIPPGLKFVKLQKMVYASDFSNFLKEFKKAESFALLFNCHLDVLTFRSEWRREETTTLFENTTQKLKSKNSSLISCGSMGDIAKDIQKYIKKNKPDLLIMFTAEQNIFDALFGRSRTEQISYNLKLPMLAIRKSILK